MTRQKEIKIVKQLSKVTEEQIKINEIGWTSRVYLIDGGRVVFKFPRNKGAQDELKHEIKVLELIKNHKFNLKTQIVKWKSDNSEYVGLKGVPGEVLTPETVESLDGSQKELLGRQLGTFLKKLHSIKGFENPAGAEQDQIDGYQEKYRKKRSLFKKYFSDNELEHIDDLFLKTAPKRIEELGNDIVFCHGDFGYNNILVDRDLTAGVIDFGDAGLNDRSIDFVDFDDETVLKSAVKAYGGNDILREKIAIRQKTFPIYLMLFYIDRKDADGIRKCIERIRRILPRNKRTERNTKAGPGDALKVFRSLISKCEKTQSKLKDGSWQKEWTIKQLEAFYAAISIIEEKQQTKINLEDALETLKKLIVKCELMRTKFKAGSPQKTLLERRINAFILTIELFENKLLLTNC